MINIKKALVVLLLLIVATLCVKDEFIVVNEIGYLGMDTSGRQVFIQTLDDVMGDDIAIVDGNATDKNLVERLMFGVSMRTTLRVILDDEASSSSNYNSLYRKSLDSPIKLLVDEFDDRYQIMMQDGYSITGKDLKFFTERYKIKTFEDLLVAFGFKKFEVVLNGNMVAEFILNNKGNTIVNGGFLKKTTVGFKPEKMEKDFEYYGEYGEFPPDYILD